MSTEHPWVGWPSGYERIVLERVDSTMREAARRAPELTAPTWILAKRQTEPYGRRGRDWQNPVGNFGATLLMKPDCTPHDAALRSFLAANALHATLGHLVNADYLSLKWPNDVLLNGGKVAGILLESSGTAGKVDWLSIGIGVNLLAAPAPSALEPRALRPVSLAGEGGHPVTREEFLTSLASHYAAEEARFREQGFGANLRVWLQHAAHLGDSITARTGDEEITGIFETVDDDGHLILKTPDGRRSIAAADIFF